MTTLLLSVIIMVFFPPGVISTVVAPKTVLVPVMVTVDFGLVTELLPVMAAGTCVPHTTLPELSVVIIVFILPGLISTEVAPNTVLVPKTLIVAFGLVTELLPVIAVGTCVPQTTLPEPSVVMMVL
ncbi:hypothetical protein D3C80_1180830 [compost metagenome]